MRTLLLFSFVVSLFSLAKTSQAQTLQFSQVLLVSTTQTVPANKVWKVEGVMPVANCSGQGGSCYSMVSINGNSVPFGSWSGLVFYPCVDNPLWLPAGTILAAGSNVFRVSVIEFTVVP